MTIIGDVFKELFKMFVADLRLTLSVLIGVGVIATALKTSLIGPVLAGVALVVLCLGVLFEVVLRETRTRPATKD